MLLKITKINLIPFFFFSPLPERPWKDSSCLLRGMTEERKKSKLTHQLTKTNLNPHPLQTTACRDRPLWPKPTVWDVNCRMLWDSPPPKPRASLVYVGRSEAEGHSSSSSSINPFPFELLPLWFFTAGLPAGTYYSQTKARLALIVIRSPWVVGLAGKTIII